MNFNRLRLSVPMFVLLKFEYEGTGKIFIGVAIAKTVIQNSPTAKIAVSCYTNHAVSSRTISTDKIVNVT